MGSHPDFGIAMERTFTEATQGNDIIEYTNRSILDFFNAQTDNPDNIMNSFKTGHAQYPHEIFGEVPSFQYTPVKNIEGLTQREILQRWVGDILNDGYDILIRDVSTLGFPSYHVIIPGLSELRTDTDKEIRAENTRVVASGLISNISKINRENCKYVIGSLAYYSDRLMENTITSFIPDSENLSIPFGSQHNGSIYLSAMCYAFMGEFNKSYIQLRKLATYLASSEENFEETKRALIAMHYMACRSIGYSHEESLTYLRKFFSSSLCDHIDDIFKDSDLILVKQYPEISKIVNSDDALRSYRLINKLVDILKESRVVNPIRQDNLKEIFEERG